MARDDTKVSRPRGVQTIETGGRILTALSRAKGPMQLRDLAEQVDIPGAQLHPYLVSFREMQMVEQTERGQYQLGPFALHLGLSRLRNQNPYRDTIARVGTLSDELGLMVSISVWGMHGPTITYVQEFDGRIHANVQVGGNYNMTVTATGAVFGAFLPKSITQDVVDRELSDAEFQRRTYFKVDADVYVAAAAKAKSNGYALTRDMPIPGVSAIAAPVFDHTGTIQLAVTVIGPSGHIDLSPDGEPVRRLMAFTGDLSRDLGHGSDA
ncbi:helix-turn-helix domain-containing protein [Sulfitobacter sp. S0837]|uniref:IclR family transcriptional regulator n=1 Tax=Sulfitobacter maritimus TaxID=2741719 RepID=UPI001584406A|nr:IclR family transcriptional regulator C-terminal domain-containing protein [Sulfitobacter maritimus]NUH65096.1 helix-turn-helix domain-containing protein [Sulfitobacter maritimus]